MQIVLIVVDLSWIDLSISQYKMDTTSERQKGAQQFTSAVILATRTGYLARLLHRLLSDAYSQVSLSNIFRYQPTFKQLRIIGQCVDLVTHSAIHGKMHLLYIIPL